jgi:hypothetical protein
MARTVVEQQGVGPFVGHDEIHVSVPVRIAQFQVLGDIRRRRDSKVRLVPEISFAIIDQDGVLPIVGQEEVGESVEVQVRHYESVGGPRHRNPAAFIAEGPESVVQEELIHLVVLANDDHIQVSIPVKIRDAHVLAVVLCSRKPVAGIGEVAFTVVQEEDIGPELIGDDDVQVTVPVQISDSGVHTEAVENPRRKMGIRDIPE